MRPDNFDPQAIIDALNGTCNTIQEALDDYYPDMDEMDLTSADHDAIDSQIFRCACCGWWCEAHEANENKDGSGEDVCEDCGNMDDDGTDEEE